MIDAPGPLPLTYDSESNDGTCNQVAARKGYMIIYVARE